VRQQSSYSRLNRIVAKCAEELVIATQRDYGVEKLVRKYAGWGVDFDMPSVPGDRPDSFVLAAILNVRKRK
jgi:hypothetical protein